MLAIVIMMNNYFHDLATATLATSAMVMLGLLAALGPEPRKEVAAVVLQVYPKVTLLARIALVWIIVGGIPRTLFFERFELWDAASKGIFAALAIKHVVMFVMVGAGAVLWVRLGRRVRDLREHGSTN